MQRLFLSTLPRSGWLWPYTSGSHTYVLITYSCRKNNIKEALSEQVLLPTLCKVAFIHSIFSLCYCFKVRWYFSAIYCNKRLWFTLSMRFYFPWPLTLSLLPPETWWWHRGNVSSRQFLCQFLRFYSADLYCCALGMWALWRAPPVSAHLSACQCLAEISTYWPYCLFRSEATARWKPRIHFIEKLTFLCCTSIKSIRELLLFFAHS